MSGMEESLLRWNNLNVIFDAIKRDPSTPIVARDDKKTVNAL